MPEATTGSLPTRELDRGYSRPVLSLTEPNLVQSSRLFFEPHLHRIVVLCGPALQQLVEGCPGARLCRSLNGSNRSSSDRE
jgi:hypothetical protein